MFNSDAQFFWLQYFEGFLKIYPMGAIEKMKEGHPFKESSPHKF